MTSEKSKDPARERLLPDSYIIEEDMVGRAIDEITILPPGEKCNARRSTDPESAADYDIPLEQVDESADRIFVGYCNQPAGYQTDGDERCKFHNGGGGHTNGGAPKANQNATKSGLTADPKNYHEHLPAEEREFVLDLSASLEDRIRKNTGEVDYVDRILARRIAIKLHIAAKATERINRDDLTQTVFTEDGSFDKKHPIIDEIRMYDSEVVSEMKTIGILDDPESRKADALEDWRSFIEQ